MTHLFSWVLQTTWQAAVLVVFILSAQFLLRRRLSPGWRHGLWLLLVARLVMPSVPSSPLSVFNVARPAQPAMMPFLARSENSPAPSRKFHATVVPRPVEPAPSSPEAKAEYSPRPSAIVLPRAKGFSWRVLVLGAWLAGAGYFLLRLVWSNLRFSRRIQTCAPPVDERLRGELERCRKIMGVHERIELTETAEVTSPAVYGLFRKRLLLPAGLASQFSAPDLRHIFLHELAHIKRRDLELTALIGILRAIHWFNPVLWLAFRQMRADRELATDALVLARVRPEESTEYGETILRLLEWLPRNRRSASLVGIMEEKKQIETRVRYIAGVGRRRYWPMIAAAVLVLLAVCVCTDMRAVGQNDKSGGNDPLGEAQASPRARELIGTLKTTSRWTFGPRAALFADEDGEVSGGFIRSVQIRDHAMGLDEIAALGAVSPGGVPAEARKEGLVQWNFEGNLVSANGLWALEPGASAAAQAPGFRFMRQEIAGESAQVLQFDAGTYFVLPNPFRDPVGRPLVTDYTVTMDVMFPAYPSRWAALWQTDPENKSDAEWFISSEKGIGITDVYSGRVPPGQWHRLTLLVEGSEARFRSFIDGTEVQRKELDVRDELYNRRRDEDVVSWTKSLEELGALNDPTTARALEKFSNRLTHGAEGAQIRTYEAAPRETVVLKSHDRNEISQRAWAASLSTSQLLRALAGKSRWSLGEEALLFADENGENAGGLVNALQLRNYAMSDQEVATLGEAGPELPKPGALPPAGQFSQWDFNGTLDSSTGGEALIPAACRPTREPEFAFAPWDEASNGPAAARFTRGTFFIVPTGFNLPEGESVLLNYSVVMDVRFDERPVGWVSLWQNDIANHTDADWFINKKQELGIRDLYGGMVADGRWHRLAWVVDGRNGLITHYINGKKVRAKRMILEDEYSRRGGAEHRLDSMIALISELETRSEPAAADLIAIFARRMHNRPDPDAVYPAVAVTVRAVDSKSGKPMPGIKVFYQIGESNEDFFPEYVMTDPRGVAHLNVALPIANALHVTARAPGYAPTSLALAAASLVSGAAMNYELPLEPASAIGGTVENQNGQPVPNAQIRLISGDFDSDTWAVPSWKELITTGFNGRWKADFLPASASAIQLEITSPSGVRTNIQIDRGTAEFEQLSQFASVFRVQEE